MLRVSNHQDSKFNGMKKRFILSALLLIMSLGFCLGGNPYTTLYIYGGEDGDVYLGKLNASRYDSESIWNEYGKYGNKYRSDCIWNEYGKYGSKYSRYSPFNEYASHPPVLKDKNGRFYGYFTVNKYKSKRANYDIVDTICENYEKIRDDLDDWYDVIF